MKKKLFLLLSLAGLVGCTPKYQNTTSVAPSNSETSDSTADEDSSTTGGHKSEKDIVEIGLGNSRKDISFKGTSNKKRHFTNPYYAVSDTDFDSTDEITILRDSYLRKTVREDDTTSERRAYKDSLGRACEQYLTYKSEVGLTPIVDNMGSDVLFESDYGNPFDIVRYEDLLKEGEQYKLTGDKAQIFVYRLTGEKVQGDVLLTIEERGVTAISGSDLTGEEYFVSTQSYAKIETTFSFDYVLSETILPIEASVTPAENENPELATVLAKLKDGFRFNNLMDGEIAMSSYFTGDSILYQMMDPGAESPQFFDIYLTKNDEETMDLYWCNMSEEDGTLFFTENDPAETEMYFEKEDYSYLASDIENLSASVFVPGTEPNTYVPEESALKLIGEKTIPGLYDALGLATYEEFRLSMTNLTLTLVDEETFNIDCQAVISASGATARITASLQFAEIGNTALPYTPELPSA